MAMPEGVATGARRPELGRRFGVFEASSACVRTGTGLEDGWRMTGG